MGTSIGAAPVVVVPEAAGCVVRVGVVSKRLILSVVTSHRLVSGLLLTAS